jgi:hypothetical protein
MGAQLITKRELKKAGRKMSAGFSLGFANQ